MGFKDYISESEAASLAGVSPNTLNRFAEAGYLEIETDSDGLHLFSKQELCNVFGIEELKPRPRINIEKTRIDQIEESLKKEAEEAKSAEKDTAEEASSQETKKQTSTLTDDEIALFANNASPITMHASKLDAKPDGAIVDQELTKLSNIVELQEKILDSQDEVIADLKKEREWLRARVEKLEEKSDRDQMLLLSEKQVTRQWIAYQQRKPSPLRAALEWMGFVEPASANNFLPGAIEMKEKRE